MEPGGRGVPLSPSTYTPQILQKLKISSGEKMGMLSRARARPAAPQLHAGTLLSSSPACSVPSHPSSQVSPSQLLPRRSPAFCLGRLPRRPRMEPDLDPRPPLAGGTRGDPAPLTPLCVSRPDAPGAARSPSAQVPRSPKRKRSKKKRPGNSLGPREHPSPEAPLSRTARRH